MAKVIVEAISTPNIWHFTEAPELRIYALTDFINDDGIQVLRGRVGTDEPHLKVPVSLSGGGLVYNSFEIDSSYQLGSNVAPARYSAGLKTRQAWKLYLSNFIVPPEPNNTTWNDLKVFQRVASRRYGSWATGGLEASMMALIADALTFLRYGSETRAGMVALTEDPIDPLYPIAVSANDPAWLAIQGGTGLAVETGLATMVDGRATVASALITANKFVLPVGYDAGVTGTLHIENIVEEVSFDIASNNPGDNGQVGWAMFTT